MGKGSVTDIRVVARGREASKIVAQVLPTAHDIEVMTNIGPVVLKPGSVFRGNRVLVHAGLATALFTIDDRLLESGTPQFLRDEWLIALKEGATRALPMITLAKVECELIKGLLVPFYLVLGLTVAKVIISYVRHKTLVNAALAQTDRILKIIHQFRSHYPRTFESMLQTAAKTVIMNWPSGISAEDIGFFMGRTIRGLYGLPEPALGAILRVGLKCAVLVAGSRSLPIAWEGLQVAARQKAELLQTQLAEVGIKASIEEARLIALELLSQSDTQERLRELQQGLHDLIPLLQQLQAAMGGAKGAQ